jgi:hypothetical protein
MFENDGGLAVFVDDDVEEVVEEEEEEEEEEETARGGEVGCGWTSHKIWRGISVQHWLARDITVPMTARESRGTRGIQN